MDWPTDESKQASDIIARLQSTEAELQRGYEREVSAATASMDLGRQERQLGRDQSKRQARHQKSRACYWCGREDHVEEGCQWKHQWEERQRRAYAFGAGVRDNQPHGRQRRRSQSNARANAVQVEPPVRVMSCRADWDKWEAELAERPQVPEEPIVLFPGGKTPRQRHPLAQRPPHV